ncbi:hypothetical protein CTAYLR_001459 [Chrysophaeum taylorii]|uniref:VTT domain-containing protein n=1 Tax=Chrysophaeum taylorii TaxID=2483200 RepID=A0AAD7U8U9_9STRA|nr:hypothetical protein CTAYLR_001459 [Chrysophaeum taylorii]
MAPLSGVGGSRELKLLSTRALRPDVDPKESRELRRVLRQELRLHKRPFATLGHFGRAVGKAMGGTSVSSAMVAASVAVCAGFAIRVGARAGAYGQRIETASKALETFLLYCAWWFFCGVLSTIGLGSGLQTGALFLFPHVARLALEWRKCGGAAFDGQFRDSWFATRPRLLACVEREKKRRAPWRVLMARVVLPGVFSGAGSAVGELVPFALARAMTSTGRDPFQLLVPDGEDEPRLFSTTRAALERSLRSYAFLKIFVLAAIPNAFFDLCGLVCGSIGVSFATFFVAVLCAKALVRTPLQTTCVAALVASLADDRPVQGSGVVVWLKNAAKRLTDRLVVQAAGNHHDDQAAAAAAAAADLGVFATLKRGWTLVTLLLFALFISSTIEQVAQQRALGHLLILNKPTTTTTTTTTTKPDDSSS